MKPRIVVDTNLWIRALLGGPATLPVLEAWRAGKFLVLISQPLLDELEAVSKRPRLRLRIGSSQASTLMEQLYWRGEWIEATAVPPRCRDPKDHPVLATAISGYADAIVSGDGDLRADDELRQQMLAYGVRIWGVKTLLDGLQEQQDTESKTEQTAWGFHLILDCFGCDEEVCCDLDRGYEFLDQICIHLKMTKQTQPYIFKTCERTFPGVPGYSGWVPIIESGIQIHTSANNRFISIDVYSCKPFNPRPVIDFVRNWFCPKQIDTCFIDRGKDIMNRHYWSEMV